MNRSRCHEDIHRRPLGVLFDKTSSKFPFRIFGQRMGGRCQSVSCGCPVLMRGVDRCWCQRCWCQGGARCEGVSCEVSVCEMVVSRRSGRSSRFVRRRCSLNGVVSYKACHRRTMSPCPVVVGGFLLRLCLQWFQELKRPSAGVRSCRSMACWKTRPRVHVAGVPLSSVRRETVGLSFLSVATWCRRWKGTTCASSG